MSTFILVHGAWQSSGTWDRLSPLLQKHGDKVIMPILRGLGTDQDHLTEKIGLHTHTEDVGKELAALQSPAVLVGHSYAGMIITAAANAYPDKVEALVYLDAFIPDDGQCVLDLLPPDLGAYFRKIARESGNGWRLPGGEGQLDLWGLKPGEARDFVRARLCDFSLRCFEESVRLGKNRKPVPAVFVSCVAEGYPARPFFEPFAKKARASGWQVHELETGHDCHVERPEEVANILRSSRVAA